MANEVYQLKVNNATITLGKGPDADDAFVSVKECKQRIEAAKPHLTIATCTFTLVIGDQIICTMLLPTTLPETSQQGQGHWDAQALQEFLSNNDTEMLPILSSYSSSGEVFPALGIVGDFIILPGQESEEWDSLDAATFFIL